MLPSLGALSLGPSPARTGEFVTLSREEADELNARGEIEPVSHEEYVPSRELPDGDDYFRVRFKYQKPDHTYDYTVYDAETLWRWTKDRYTLPHNRQPIWREDWMALHWRYDPEGAVPQRVARLPRLKSHVDVYEGSGDQRRRVRTEFPSGQVRFYGDNGAAVRHEFRSGQVNFLEGFPGQERVVRMKWKHAMIFYDGPKGEEHVVREEHIDGNVFYYEGSKGEERLVRSEPEQNGTKVFYNGPKGEERMVRMEGLPGGRVMFFDGPKGEEHMVRAEYGAGFVDYYKGPKGQERAVRTKDARGVIDYDGPRGKLRMVSHEYPDGKVVNYEGDKGEEHVVSIYDRYVEYYEGPKGAEHLVRREFGDGDVQFYEGAKDAERLVATRGRVVDCV